MRRGRILRMCDYGGAVSGRKTVKRILATVVGAVLALTLTACSSQDGNAPVAASVHVTGDFGAEPQVSFDTPLKASEVQHAVVISGSGDTVTSTDTVYLRVALYNGDDQSVLSAWTDTPTQVSLNSVEPAISTSLDGVASGSRVVITADAQNFFGAENVSSVGLSADQPLAAVIDLLGKPETQRIDGNRAQGAAQPAPAGFPAVTLADDGTPTIATPSGSAPTQTETAVLITGDGPAVPADATVIVQYVGVRWADGQQFDSSWSRGMPATFSIAPGQVITGFSTAITGQTVGSQVIVKTSSKDAYGDSPSGSQPAGSLVFVIDILGYQTWPSN